MFKKIGLTVVFLFLYYANVFASSSILEDVPAYNWYHGCAPTSAASVFGYWDINGYDNLFDAQGWAQVRWTNNVKEQISSTAHNDKYDPFPDNASLAEPADTSIADFMHTSEGDLDFGGTYLNNISTGIREYSAYRGYVFSAYDRYFANFSSADLKAEIDAGRPLLLMVDVSKDGVPDHSVPVLGYKEEGGNFFYGMYDTWSEGIEANEQIDMEWNLYQGVGIGTEWGVYGATTIIPVSSPSYTVTPEPVSLLLFVVGGMFFSLYKKRKLCSSL